MGVCLWSTPRPGRFTPGNKPVPIVQEAGWAPGPVWIGAEYLANIGIRSSDRLACSESLYRLSYPGPRLCCDKFKKCKIRLLYVQSECCI